MEQSTKCSTSNIALFTGKWAPTAVTTDKNNRLRYSEPARRSCDNESSGEKDKKFRIALCIYALMGLTLCQMSKMNLNVSIVEMTINSEDRVNASRPRTNKYDGSCPYGDRIETSNRSNLIPIRTILLPTKLYKEIPDKNNNRSSSQDAKSLMRDRINVTSSIVDGGQPAKNITTGASSIQRMQTTKYRKFNWTSKQQNLLLGAFYITYAPLMILGGVLSERYGNKYLIFMSVGGSSIINFATPALARFSFEILVASRMLLGVMQAAIFPALYDLFAKWLTMTETSIFAPLIKVSFSLGILLGSLLPGVIIGNGYGWPLVFQSSGAICLVWALVWFFVSDSSPQQSRFVGQPELNRIMRKKAPLAASSLDSFCPDTEKAKIDTNSHANDTCDLGPKSAHNNAQAREKTPWGLILTSPSVLSLILVKFTYQLCLDFASIELASYLKKPFHAPVETISAITVVMYAIQVLFIVLVGILAKNMVRNKAFGWSKTTTRKVFQGLANFSMAIVYLLISYSNCNITLVAVLLQLISFFWMFGAGGETMLPYDLSEKYPATIVGIAHSACGISGLVMALVTGQILGDRGNDNARWNVLLRLVAGCSFVGGLVFTLVVKAEPIEAKRRTPNSGRSEQEGLADTRLGAECEKDITGHCSPGAVAM